MSVVQFPDGSEFDDDGSTAGTMLRGGHRQNLIPMLSKTVGVAAQVVADKLASAGSAGAAAGSAENAAGYAQTALEKAAQTVMDRIATGADRVATGQDRTAVADMLDSIADGPVTSVNGLGGVVTLKTVAGQGLTGTGDIPLPSPSIVRSARTANAQLVAADTTKLIDITSGTFTQTFAAASALGSGWYVHLRNSGTGVITLDANGAETVDGVTTLVLHPGHTRLIQCDGTALRTILIAGDEIFIAVDQKSAGTGGGTSVTGINTRVLNTVLANTINGASLASNVITLPAGTYTVSGSCPAYNSAQHKARLYISGFPTQYVDGTGDNNVQYPGTTRSVIVGQFVLSATSTVRIDHYTSSSVSLGQPAGGSATPEVYSEITIRKIA